MSAGRRSPPGTYLLLLHLPTPADLAVGRLGQIAFPAGWYVYVGSALGGLDARLRRHARRGKPVHWHVDALREVADLVAVLVHLGPERLECATATLVAALPAAHRPVRGFGSSDCRCLSHLVHFAERPELELGDRFTDSGVLGQIFQVGCEILDLSPDALKG